MQDNDNARPSDEDNKDMTPESELEMELEADYPAEPETDAEMIAANFEALQAEVAAAKDQQLRALAEVENMRRRTQREREEASKYGAVGLARDLLTVADNLGRALVAAPEDHADEAVKALVAGVAMVERELATTLEKHKVKLVPGVGEPFDHNVHQAVVELESAEIPPGHVVQVLQPGYTLHDRLLRPAMVAVAKASVAS